MRNLFPPRARSISRRTRATRARRVGLERLEGRELLTGVGVPDGLVSWWTADGTAADKTGLNNATLYNGATYAAGEVGQAFSFDGANDRAEVADSPSLALTGSLTIEGWIKVNAFPSPSIGLATVLFRGDDRGGLDPYQLTTDSNGNLWFQAVNASGAAARISAPIATGQLVHVAATLDDATGAMKLYENGNVVAQTVTTVRPFGALDPSYNPGIGIGNANGTPTGSGYNIPFNGQIDELSIYNRALSPTEVSGIYGAGVAGKIKAANYFAADFPSVVEGAAGSSTAITFTVRRVGSLAGQAVVNWTTADGAANAGTDYVAASGQIVFEAGESQKTVQVTVNGDDAPEAHETFRLVLSTSTPGYTTGDGLATIEDDDAAISVDDSQTTEGDPRLGSLGALVSQAGNGGLVRSTGMTFGPDGNLYVGSLNTDEVLRYSPAGAFLGAFVTAGSGGLDGPAVDGLIFRNGLLYVASLNNSAVLRYDAGTGAFVDTFVTPGSGGLLGPGGMAFAPDGSLLLSSGTDEVLRYSGTTGAFLGVFVPSAVGGLNNPRSMTYGPDGNLYISSSRSNSVQKYNGSTGAFISNFIPAGNGLNAPADLLFSGGRLYVASQGTGQVLRYDAATGAFLDDALPDGGLDRPIGLVLDSDQNLLVGSYADVLRYAAPYPATFTVRLNHAVATTVTVDYATSAGTAQAGTDFTAVSGTLTFAPGETVKTVRVTVVNDVTAEPTESFTLTLSHAVGGVVIDAQGVGTVHDDDAVKFFVVDDASRGDRRYEYGELGASAGDRTLNSGNSKPRGVASSATGDRLWVVDANKKVYVYSTANSNLLGSWSLGGLASNATVEGIATNGTDVWVVDSRQDRVYRYTGAAGRLSGSQNAASSFALDAANTSPKDLVTDGTSLWVVNDSTSDTVFKYTLTGTLLGNWRLGWSGWSPTGITLDPTNVGTFWVVDSGTMRVWQFDKAASATAGEVPASMSFALDPGNTNPQGIADPPVGRSHAVATSPSAETPRPAAPALQAPQGPAFFALAPAPDQDRPMFADDLTPAGPRGLRSRLTASRRHD